MNQTTLEQVGEFRSPRNLYSGAEASIHNDAVASKLGFKGGTVAGSVHMDQFVPLILEYLWRRVARARRHVHLLHPGHGGQ